VCNAVIVNSTIWQLLFVNRADLLLCLLCSAGDAVCRVLEYLGHDVMRWAVYRSGPEKFIYPT